MPLLSRIGIAAALVAAVTALGCSDTTAPTPGTVHDRWALVSINNVALPAKPLGINYTVLADTLEFGASSSLSTPNQLAFATRRVKDADGTLRTETVWYSYPRSEPLPSPFEIRMLCADGDGPFASCIDGGAHATIDSSGLTIQFNESIFGVLRYARVTLAR